MQRVIVTEKLRF